MVLVFYMCCLFIFSGIFSGLIWNYLFKLYVRFTEKKPICVHCTCIAQYGSVYIRQTHYVSIAHLKHIICPLYSVRKTPLCPLCTYEQAVNVVQGITTLCCENNTQIVNTHCGKKCRPSVIKACGSLYTGTSNLCRINNVINCNFYYIDSFLILTAPHMVMD